MSTKSFAHQFSVEYAASTYSEPFQAPTIPIYQQLLTWLLLPNLLYLVTNGTPSFLALYTGPLMTQNAILLRTQQGIRPLIVFYYLSTFLIIFLAYKEIWRVALRNKLIIVGILYAGLSVVWSESKFLTFRGMVELALTTLFAFYLSERFTTERLMRMLTFVGVITGISSIVLVLFFPGYGLYLRDGGGGTQWQGLFSHKNGLGMEMAFLLTPIFFIRCRLFLKVAYTSMMLFLIAMSQSRGGWFITLCLLGFIAWLWLFRRLRHKESLLLAMGTGILVVIAVALGIAYLDPLMRGIGKDPTMTGRTTIYAAVIDSILSQPIFGYGYNAFWLGLNQESWKIALKIHWLQIGYAENGFLELGLQLGLIGLGLAGALFVRAIRQTGQLLHSNWYTPRVGWFASIILLELVTNIEGGVVLTPQTLNWTLTLIAFVGLAKEFKERQREESEARVQYADQSIDDPSYA